MRTRSGAPACLDRFDGMFAFAIWDDARDASSSSRATGSGSSRSTTRPRRAVPLRLGGEGPHPGRLPAPLDPAALGEYFTFQNVFSDTTLFEGVRVLPAGTSCAFARTASRRGTTGTSSFEPDDTVARHEWVDRIASPSKPASCGSS